MIKFGPSGNGDSFFAQGLKHSEDSAVFVKKLNLDCFEYSFGRGVNLSREKAISIGNAFKNSDVELSVHAPYFINLANPDDEMAEKSFGYITASASAAKLMGANRVVFHPASEGKSGRIDAVNLTKERLIRLTDRLYEYGYQDIKFCPETMGKLAQIGTIEEIVEFCKIDKIYCPCVDFGHINARENGTLNTVQDYLDRLNYMIDNLGFDRVSEMHVHFSKIQYGASGEIRHLTMADEEYGPEYTPLAEIIDEYRMTPVIICESKEVMAEDALIMKKCHKIV